MATTQRPLLWLLLSLMAATAHAQGGSIIPPGLTSDFTTSLGLEVSYQGTGSRFDGIQDGSTLPAAAVATDPVFALSDQSAVNTRIAFLVMMLDTTDPAAPVLHFAQDQFKADGVQTGISSQAQPLVAYAPPGSLGETGQRQYSFLLFQEPSGTTISGLPQAGETLNVDQFLTANNMKGARAGVGILVDNNGGGGGGGGGGGAAPAPVPPVAPGTTPIATFTSIIQTPPAVTPGAPAPVVPTQPVATPQPQPQPQPSDKPRTSEATGAATSGAAPSASAGAGGSGSSTGETGSGSGIVTAGGSVLEAIPARALAVVAGLIGGIMLV
ncbi:hypothetical protein KVR01_004458 [Diaporthe batatas]|uniref:uncharacterized protein n=1 Tax=Diaporthe batatas TaxID=748121 RepID=UPI001D050DD7|nr:uncharacterized protein KVR01_004458 [Diaporthe batatas]KAG8165906.1 hypothetical protein KVR01_004458 [Diaporthe batatas]